MEKLILTEEKKQALCRPLPSEAVTPHQTKSYLSSIKPIYVTERLNEVFGVGAWRVEVDKVDRDNKMVVVKVKFTIPAYGIEYECYGGNDNADLGDAYKGATTDAITKIASWLGIGAEVFRGEANKKTSQPKPQSQPRPQAQPTRHTLTLDKIMDEAFLKTLCEWLHKNIQGNNLDTFIRSCYDCDNETLNCLTQEYNRRYA
jgi:hypothetical protein